MATMDRKLRLAGGMAVALLVGNSVYVAQAVVKDVQLDQTKFGHVDQANVPMPPGGGGANSCVPTACANSFQYLQTVFPAVYGTSIVPTTATAAAIDLGSNYQGTSSDSGTSGDNWIDGKKNYLEAKAPGKTVYGGQYADYGGTNAFVEKVHPTLAFLYDALVAGADIEIGVIPSVPNEIGHALTLTSVHWDDANNNNIFDLGDSGTIDGIDPAGGVSFVREIFPHGAGQAIGTNYYNFEDALEDSTLVLAVTETAVPEPATLAMLVLGMGLLVKRKI